MHLTGLPHAFSAITIPLSSHRSILWLYVTWLVISFIMTSTHGLAAIRVSGNTTAAASTEISAEAQLNPLEAGKIFRCISLCKQKKNPNLLLPPEKMKSIDLRKSLCFCDQECQIFGDCCADVANSTTNSSIAYPEDLDHEEGEEMTFRGIPTHQWGCHMLNQPIGNDDEEWAYLVDSCPDDYWDLVVSAMCSNRHLIPDEEYTYILDLPVVSSLTGIPYLNSFCMTCNEEFVRLESPFYPMELIYKCLDTEPKANDTQPEEMYIRGHRKWINPGQNCTLVVSDSLKVFFGYGSDLDPNRPGNYTRRCSPREDTCEDPDLAKLCSSYAFYVQTKKSAGEKVVYKNPHCAFCHGRRREELQCFGVNIRGLIGPQTIGGPRYNLPASNYKTMVKLIWDGSDLLVNGKSEVRPGGPARSPHRRVWDFLKNESMVTGCSKGNIYVGGKCEAYVGQSTEEYPWNLTGDGGNSSGRDPEEEWRGESTEELHARIQGYLNLTCMSISVICLIMHVIIYSILPKLRNLPGRNLLALSWALLLAQSLVLLSGFDFEGSDDGWFCKILAVAIHFFYLSAMVWMNVMSIDVWRTFSSSSSRQHHIGNRESHERLHLRYSLYAWGMPLLITASAVIVDTIPTSPNSTVAFFKPHYGRSEEGMCWLRNTVATSVFFSIPVFCLIIANVALFSRSVFKIHENQESRRYMRRKAMEEESLYSQRVSKAAESDGSTVQLRGEGPMPTKTTYRPNSTSSCITSKDKSRFYLYVKLATIMGLSWVLAFAAGFAEIREIWYPIIILNGSQGAFIFFMFDVKCKVLGMLVERFTGRKPEWSGSRSSTSNWAFLRSTRSLGKRMRRKTYSEYADDALGNYSSREDKQGSTSGTTMRSSLPTSSDTEMSTVPGGQKIKNLNSNRSDMDHPEMDSMLPYMASSSEMSKKSE